MNAANEPFYIVGHRGAAGERLENSLDGFRHALSLDIDAIELDIRDHSASLWVFHDDDVDRLTNRSGAFDDLADPLEARLNNGENIPTLPQILDLYWGKMPVNIEIKSVTDAGLLLDLLSRYGPLPPLQGMPWILISCFDHDALMQLQARGCPWPLAPLSDGIPDDLETVLGRLKPWSWHFNDEALDFDQVASLRERGVASLVYTVNDPARADELRRNGVAGIFTDYPTLMLRSL